MFQSQTGSPGHLARDARFALRVDAHIAKNFNLAGKTHMRVFLQIIAQPEFLHKGEGVGAGFGGNRHAVRTTQAIAVAISKSPQAAVDGDIVL